MPDDEDPCSLVANDQTDADGDGTGDLCQSCFAIEHLKIGTKSAKCDGIVLLELTGDDGQQRAEQGVQFKP